MLPKSALYGKTGTGKKQKAAKAQQLALKQMTTGASLLNRKDHQAASSAIRNSQKESAIRLLMEKKGLTYAQAAVELMK